MKKFEGIWTALVTPFNDRGQIDWDAYAKSLKLQAEGGVNGVIPCGTTGESPTLSAEEKQKLITTTLEVLKGTPIQVAAGTGSNDTQETIEFSQWASKLSVGGQKLAGLLVVTPYYNKPSAAGLERHFTAVADAVDCPIILYNVPGRAGISMTGETIAKLARHPKIPALKEATGNVSFTSEVIDHLGELAKNFSILSGDDVTFLPLLSVGATGVISVASNLFPKEMVALYHAAQKHDYPRAAQIHQALYPVFRDFFVESNPVPVKFAMAKTGICGPYVRAPLAPLTSASEQKVLAAVKKAQAALAAAGGTK
ncbi:MAG: 4-hydroxy-tetrahydrodipicolinate synthase [Bacteriovoracia bacterium]